MKIPNIQDYSDCQKFLADVYEANRKGRGVGSFRFYATKMKWPVSYFNEVLNGKKKISLQRALQFGLFLKLDTVDLERLIYLCLRDSEFSTLQNYFQSKIETEVKTDGLYRLKKSDHNLPENVEIIPEAIYQDISLLAIYDLLGWAEGRLKPEEMAKYLFTFPELKDLKVLKAKIQTLEDHGYIKPLRKGSLITGFEKPVKRLLFSVDAKTVVHMGQYAENYIRLIRNPNQRGWVNSGFIKIHKTQLAAVKKRMAGFRNWMLEIDRECNMKAKKELQDSLVFQLDLNLFCLIDGVALGYPRLNDWMTTP